MSGGRAAATLANLANLAKATLKDPARSSEQLASTLWQEQPVAVLVLRRPGCGEHSPVTLATACHCPRHSGIFASFLTTHVQLSAVLCRDEAARLWQIKPQLDDLGVGLVCVVHEVCAAQRRHCGLVMSLAGWPSALHCTQPCWQLRTFDKRGWGRRRMYEAL